MKAPRRARGRVVAAGVMANFALAMVFFAGSALVVDSSVTPNAQGIGVVSVISGYAASNASMHSGDIVVAVNGTATPDEQSFHNALATTHPGQSVAVEYYDPARGGTVTTTVTMASLAAYTHNSSDGGTGFLGVVIDPFSPSELAGLIAAPWSSSAGPAAGLAAWVALPLWGLQPVAGTTAGFYHATGPLAGLGIGNVWVVVNLLYWLAWMNVLLGLSNALPIVPFDGGLLFRDFAGSLTARLRRGWEQARIDRVSTQASAAISVFIVLLFVWIFVGPHV